MLAAVLIAAYAAAGIAYVMGDLGEHIIRQPAYAREYTQRGRLGSWPWLSCTIFGGWRQYRGSIF
jgi:hypothetical protein